SSTRADSLAGRETCDCYEPGEDGSGLRLAELEAGQDLVAAMVYLWASRCGVLAAHVVLGVSSKHHDQRGVQNVPDPAGLSDLPSQALLPTDQDLFGTAPHFDPVLEERVGELGYDPLVPDREPMVRLRGELRRDRNDVEIVEPHDVLRFLRRSLLRVRGLCIEGNPVARVLEGDPVRAERSGRGSGGRLDDIDLRRNCAGGRRGAEQEER